MARNELDLTLKPDLSILSEGRIESIFAEFRLPNSNSPLIVGEVHRVPHLNVASTLEFFERLAARFQRTNSSVIFGTDQNCDLNKIQTNALTRNLFYNLESDGFLSQHPNQSTS